MSRAHQLCLCLFKSWQQYSLVHLPHKCRVGHREAPTAAVMPQAGAARAEGGKGVVSWLPLAARPAPHSHQHLLGTKRHRPLQPLRATNLALELRRVIPLWVLQLKVIHDAVARHMVHRNPGTLLLLHHNVTARRQQRRAVSPRSIRHKNQQIP